MIGIKTGKEIILEYCKTVKTHDIDHLQSCLEIEILLERNAETIRFYGYCPTSYLYDNYWFNGDCEIETTDDIRRSKQCEKCWDRVFKCKW